MENMIHCIWFRRGPYFYAGMAELADVQDLGSCVARRAGSSPVARTIVGASFVSLAPIFCKNQSSLTLLRLRSQLNPLRLGFLLRKPKFCIVTRTNPGSSDRLLDPGFFHVKKNALCDCLCSAGFERLFPVATHIRQNFRFIMDLSGQGRGGRCMSNT
jgi:hypothetical protein